MTDQTDPKIEYLGPTKDNKNLYRITLPETSYQKLKSIATELGLTIEEAIRRLLANHMHKDTADAD
jgi:hypothetical protein